MSKHSRKQKKSSVQSFNNFFQVLLLFLTIIIISVVIVLSMDDDPNVLVNVISTSLNTCTGSFEDPCSAIINIDATNANNVPLLPALLSNTTLYMDDVEVTDANFYQYNNKEGIFNKLLSKDFKIKKGENKIVKVEIFKRDPTKKPKFKFGNLVNITFGGYNSSSFIKYQFNGDLKCFNYNCIEVPIQVELCNPTPAFFKINLSHAEPQIISNLNGVNPLHPVGTLHENYRLNRTIKLFTTCSRTILNNASIEINEFYSCNNVNMTSEEVVIEDKPMIGEYTFNPGYCVNASIPFRAMNIPKFISGIEWQLNLTDYGFALHPFFNTDNYTQPFINTSEGNGSVSGFNSTIFNGTLTANYSGFKSGDWYNITGLQNLTQLGYEAFARSSVVGTPERGFDNQCASANDDIVWSGSNLGADWWCLNWSQGSGIRNTVIYAEIAEDRTDINIVNGNYFVTDVRPSGVGTFNASQMIKQQTAAETNVACGSNNITPARYLSGYMFCANISSAEGGSNARIGELDIWTANFTRNSLFQSNSIAMTGLMSSFKIAVNQTINGGIIGFNVSCNDGVDYTSVNQSGFDKTYTCVVGDTLKYRVLIEANTSTNSLTPVINNISIEVFRYAAEPCDYGTINDTCTITTSKSINGTLNLVNLSIQSGSVINTHNLSLSINATGFVNITGVITTGNTGTSTANLNAANISINASSINIFGGQLIAVGGGSTSNGGNSGNGGIIFLLAGNITIGDASIINASGPRGEATVGNDANGGSGGIIILNASSKINISGSLLANGGNVGQTVNSCGARSVGNGGRINITSPNIVINGTVSSVPPGSIASCNAASNGINIFNYTNLSITNYVINPAYFIGPDFPCLLVPGSNASIDRLSCVQKGNITLDSLTVTNGSFISGNGSASFLINGLLNLSGSVWLAGNVSLVINASNVVMSRDNNFSNVSFSVANDVNFTGLTLARAMTVVASNLIINNTFTVSDLNARSGDRNLFINFYVTNNVTIQGLVNLTGGRLATNVGGRAYGGGNLTIRASTVFINNTIDISGGDTNNNGQFSGPAGKLNISASRIELTSLIRGTGGIAFTSDSSGATGGILILNSSFLNLSGPVTVDGGAGLSSTGCGGGQGRAGDSGDIFIVGGNEVYINGVLNASKGTDGCRNADGGRIHINGTNIWVRSIIRSQGNATDSVGVINITGLNISIDGGILNGTQTVTTSISRNSTIIFDFQNFINVTAANITGGNSRFSLSNLFGRITLFNLNFSTDLLNNRSIWNVSNNRAFANSSLDSRLNVSATITLNVSTTNAVVPQIDLEDDGSFINCASSYHTCTTLVNSSNTLMFNTTGWTAYQGGAPIVSIPPSVQNISFAPNASVANIVNSTRLNVSFAIAGQNNTMYELIVSWIRNGTKVQIERFNITNETSGFSLNRTSNVSSGYNISNGLRRNETIVVEINVSNGSVSNVTNSTVFSINNSIPLSPTLNYTALGGSPLVTTNNSNVSLRMNLPVNPDNDSDIVRMVWFINGTFNQTTNTVNFTLIVADGIDRWYNFNATSEDIYVNVSMTGISTTGDIHVDSLDPVPLIISTRNESLGTINVTYNVTETTTKVWLYYGENSSSLLQNLTNESVLTWDGFTTRYFRVTGLKDGINYTFELVAWDNSSAPNFGNTSNTLSAYSLNNTRPSVQNISFAPNASVANIVNTTRLNVSFAVIDDLNNTATSPLIVTISWIRNGTKVQIEQLTVNNTNSLNGQWIGNISSGYNVSNGLRRNETITVEINVTDGSLSNVTNSTTFSINNSIPNRAEYFYLDGFTNNTNVTLIVNASVDNDTDSLRYVWFLNGTLNQTTNTRNLTLIVANNSVVTYSYNVSVDDGFVNVTMDSTSSVRTFRVDSVDPLPNISRAINASTSSINITINVSETTERLWIYYGENSTALLQNITNETEIVWLGGQSRDFQINGLKSGLNYTFALVVWDNSSPQNMGNTSTTVSAYTDNVSNIAPSAQNISFTPNASQSNIVNTTQLNVSFAFVDDTNTTVIATACWIRNNTKVQCEYFNGTSLSNRSIGYNVSNGLRRNETIVLEINVTDGGASNVSNSTVFSINNTVALRANFNTTNLFTNNSNVTLRINFSAYPYDPNDTDLIRIQWFVNGTFNQSTNTTNLTLVVADGIDRWYNYNVSIDDGFSNTSMNVAPVAFHVDSLDPIPAFILVRNISPTRINVTVNVSETSTKVWVYYGLNNTIVNNVTNESVIDWSVITQLSFIITGLTANSNYTFTLVAWDNSSPSNYGNVTSTISAFTDPPSDVPGPASEGSGGGGSLPLLLAPTAFPEVSEALWRLEPESFQATVPFITPDVKKFRIASSRPINSCVVLDGPVTCEAQTTGFIIGNDVNSASKTITDVPFRLRLISQGSQLMKEYNGNMRVINLGASISLPFGVRLPNGFNDRNNLLHYAIWFLNIPFDVNDGVIIGVRIVPLIVVSIGLLWYVWYYQILSSGAGIVAGA